MGRAGEEAPEMKIVDVTLLVERTSLSFMTTIYIPEIAFPAAGFGAVSGTLKVSYSIKSQTVPDFQVTLLPASYTALSSPTKTHSVVKTKQNKSFAALENLWVEGREAEWRGRSGGVMEVADTLGRASVPLPQVSSYYGPILL